MNCLVKPLIKPIELKHIQLVASKHWPKLPPDCGQCKFSIPQQNNDRVCKLFKQSSLSVNKVKFNYYMDTSICRGDENFCGREGFYYKQK